MKRSLSHHKFLSFAFISLFAITLALFLSSSVAFAENKYTETEPNDSFENANAIEIGEEVHGNDDFEVNKTDDYFKFTVTKKAVYYFNLDVDRLGGLVTVYDENRKLVNFDSLDEEKNGYASSKYWSSHIANLKEGNYYVCLKCPYSSYNFMIEEKTDWNSKIKFYRLYNSFTGEHFYTTSTVEKETLISYGWENESSWLFVPIKSNTPVYRFYNKYAGDHHFTTDEKEMQALKEAGWTYEGIGFYSHDGKDTPVYRQYNPNARVGMHNFTDNKDEVENLVKLGWKNEKIAWYGITMTATIS